MGGCSRALKQRKNGDRIRMHNTRKKVTHIPRASVELGQALGQSCARQQERKRKGCKSEHHISFAPPAPAESANRMQNVSYVPIHSSQRVVTIAFCRVSFRSSVHNKFVLPKRSRGSLHRLEQSWRGCDSASDLCAGMLCHMIGT